MRLNKSVLRECARLALKQRGFSVDVIGGAGIVPGARLRATKDSEERIVAVRTSLDREVGLTRQPDGRWSTIPRVDEVIVVVPAADKSNSAEVLGFTPEAIMQTFDVALEARQKKSLKLKNKAPIFVALDEPKRGRRPDVESGLKTKAEWQIVMPLAAVPRDKLLPNKSRVGFIQRVQQEFADLHGVDVSKVTVEFRIKS